MAQEPSPTRYDLLADDELLRLPEIEEDRLEREAVDEFVRRGEGMIVPLSAICRNDPCPCGSGRKYERCHGAK